jgi:hypothetical protein
MSKIRSPPRLSVFSVFWFFFFLFVPTTALMRKIFREFHDRLLVRFMINHHQDALATSALTLHGQQEPAASKGRLGTPVAS